MKDPHLFLRNVSNYPAESYIRGIIRDWADHIAIPNRRSYDEDWQAHALIEHAMKALLYDLGFQKAIFPMECGGWNLGQTDSVATMCGWMFEEVSRADSGIGVAMGVCYWPLIMIAAKPHVNMRLCKEFAPMFVDADGPRLSALCLTEPQGGADIENIDIVKGRTLKTTARLVGDEWVINGHKLWPTNTGGEADLMAVLCTTNPGSENPDDIACIYVPADTPGVTQGKPYEKVGMAADKNGDIWFEEVRVPAWYRAHGPGLDALYFREVLAFAMLSSFYALGPLINTYEILYEFCSQKTLNGIPLKEHDAVAAELSEIVGGIEVSRASVYRLAAMLDRPDIHGARWSHEVVSYGRATKHVVVDRCIKDIERAMDIMGTYGADRLWDVEKHWRDIKIIQLWVGGKQLCQMEGSRFYFGSQTL